VNNPDQGESGILERRKDIYLLFVSVEFPACYFTEKSKKNKHFLKKLKKKLTSDKKHFTFYKM